MNLMTGPAPHWHLLLNHLPTVGAAIGLGLLLYALYAKSEDLTRASLAIFVILGLVAIPTYISGTAAARTLSERADIPLEVITAHEDAALYAFAALMALGWVSWFALWQYRRFSRPYRWSVPTAAVLAGLALLVMARTGTLGGEINHPEIRSGDPVSASGRTAALAAWVLGNPAVWPTLEAIHFIGMSALFGAVLLMMIRVLGVGRSVPFSALHRLLPLATFGFMMNVVSGMLFFVADSDRYVAMTNSFFPKMALVVIGGVAVLYFTLLDETWNLRSGDDAPWPPKLVAAATLLIWTGVIVYGRLLPYLEGG